MSITPRFPPSLPPDTLGWAASPHYQSPLLAGTDNKEGTAGSIVSPLGCSYEALSTLEQKGVRIAHLNPNVLDARAQVPMCTSTEFSDLVRRYEGRVPRSSVAFLDIVLTMRAPAPKDFEYVVLNVKEVKRLRSPAVIRRMLREQVFCKRVGWRWYLATELELPIADALKAKLLMNWVKHITASPNELQRLATFVQANADGARLIDVLDRASRLLKIDADLAAGQFAFCVLEGLLRLDLSHPFGMPVPLALTSGLME